MRGRHDTTPTPRARHSVATPRRVRARTVRVSAIVAALLVGGGIALGHHLMTRRVPSPGTAPSTAQAAKLPAPTAPSAVPVPDAGSSGSLAADFARLQTTLHAKVGLAVRALGDAQPDPTVLGDWQTGPAWSTIKVPLVIAALRREDSPDISDAMTKAITESDNAAAELIWDGLGDPTGAASAVQDVLRQSGDPTVVQSQKVRPEFTAFGQTMWPLVDQARFTAVALCDPQNAQVFDLMGRIEDDQRWGLGVITGAKFKGGWGPSSEGKYLVRQMGVVPTPGGLAVVTVAAEPDSGSFADGIQVLSTVAEWLGARLAELPSGRCGA
jgi:hypothetical protein